MRSRVPRSARSEPSSCRRPTDRRPGEHARWRVDPRARDLDGGARHRRSAGRAHLAGPLRWRVADRAMARRASGRRSRAAPARPRGARRRRCDVSRTVEVAANDYVISASSGAASATARWSGPAASRVSSRAAGRSTARDRSRSGPVACGRRASFASTGRPSRPTSSSSIPTPARSRGPTSRWPTRLDPRAAHHLARGRPRRRGRRDRRVRAVVGQELRRRVWLRRA